MSDRNNLRRSCSRAAVKIHQHLIGPAQVPRLPMLPRDQWDKVCQMVERFELVRDKGWYAAAQDLRRDLNYQLRQFQSELSQYQEQLPALTAPGTIAHAREIATDLEALFKEFDEVAIDLKEKTVGVVTEPIVLEGLRLGPFKIVLEWERIGQKPAYEVIAQEPHRPEVDDEVTHPHVRKDVLCEGDGAIAIKCALLQGRLQDFFTLVQQVLSTYNDASAYVSLNRWNGATCVDCGYEMDSDHGNCERCEEPLCSECSCSCSDCDRYVCGGCLHECSGCGERFCRSCLTDGPESTLYCQPCLEKGDSDDDGETIAGEDQEDAAGSEADAVCLGEAPVPARCGRYRGGRLCHLRRR